MKPEPKPQKTAKSRKPLSRERILRAAAGLADERGLEMLSMRKLASSLGVEAMSLYNHVRAKDDLLDGLVELVVAEIERPNPSGDWRVAMRRRATSAHTALLCHPWATQLIISRINTGPAMLAYVDATLGSLLNAGFSLELADHAWNAMDSYIYGFTLQELLFPFEQADYADAAEQYMPQLSDGKHVHLERLAQLVAGGSYDGVHSLELGLELLLDGLERLRVSESGVGNEQRHDDEDQERNEPDD